MAGFWDLLFPGGEGAIADLFWSQPSRGRPSSSYSGSSTPSTPSSTPTTPIREGIYTHEGTSGEDIVNTNYLHRSYPEYSGYAIEGKDGDDTLSAHIFNDKRGDQLYGEEGNDFLSAASYMTDYASVVVSGGTESSI